MDRKLFDSGWYPELVFLTVVFPNSTDLAFTWLYFVAVIYWKTFHKTLLLENTRVELVLLNNTTDGNTSSGIHPVIDL